MKSLSKICVLLLTLLLMSVSYVSATDVSGMISEDTTWTLAGSPYNLISDIPTIPDDPGAVGIADGVTLTIESGVEISTGSIVVHGKLLVIGAENNPVIFNNTRISYGVGTVDIDFATFYGGVIGGAVSGIITNSYFEGVFINPEFPMSDWLFEKNSFRGGDNWFKLDGDKKVVFRNNVFYYTGEDDSVLTFPSPVIVSNGIFDTAAVIFEFNSFLYTERGFFDNFWIEGEPDTFNIIAINNYWGVEDPTIFRSNLFGGIEYIPFLTEAHPDTPIPDYNLYPYANSGSEQIVHDKVTLDSSLSYDPDGSTISSYEWFLQHRTDPNEYLTAVGPNPTVSGLIKGYYDVCLTVKDDQGLPGESCSLIIAAGPCEECICEDPDPEPEPVVDPYMYVNSIDLSTKAWFFRRYYGVAEIQVIDDLGNPVEGATVAGTFSGSYSETNAAITNSNGVAKITTSSRTRNPSFEFCVTGVTKDSLVYDSSYNGESCDSK